MPGDLRLLRLLERFDLDLHLLQLPDTTTWMAAAIWAGSDSPGAADGGVFTGTGFAPAEAVRGCLGEFAEYQSWLYRPGDAARHEPRAALGPAALDPWDLLGFRDVSAAEGNWGGFDPAPDPATFAGAIDWSPVRRLGDDLAHWLPAQLCHGRHASRGGNTGSEWRSDSNGCAAGETVAEAEEAALLELIERDATGIWWHGRHRRPAFDSAAGAQEGLETAVAARAKAGQTTSFLDLTHDVGVPVAAAILLDAEGSLNGIGFGCHADPARALRSAYLEMSQMEVSIALLRQRAAAKGTEASAEDRRLLRWLEQANLRNLPHLLPDDTAIPVPTQAAPPLDRLRQLGLSVYRLDLQRADIGIPAVRLFAPGLCHYKPRLAFKRLVGVPRKLGWCESGFGAADLSTLPLMI